MVMRVDELCDAYRRNGLGLKQASEDELLRMVADGPGTIQRKFLDRVSEIATDPNLTPAGRKVARDEAGRAATKALAAWHAPLAAGLAENERGLLDQLRKATAPSRPSDVGAVLEAALLRAEIRNRASGLAPEQHEDLYRRGGPTIRAALEEAPLIAAGPHGAVVIRAFVGADVRDEVILAEGAAMLPDVASRLADVRTTGKILSIGSGTAAEAVRAHAPDSLLAPIVTLAP